MQNNNDLTISKIEQMSNYFQLLYQKVKSGEIEVGKIFLLKILEDYLTFLLTTHSESVNLEMVANFLVAVSELILWKTNLLLPFPQTQIVEEMESEIEIFKENYWKEYKKYQSLVPVLLKKEFEQREIYLTCPNLIDDVEEIPQNYDFSELILALESVLNKDNDVNIIDIKDYEINIEKKMKEIEELFFKNENKITFRQIVCNNPPKIEIIIIFLALLQLICQGKVDYLQTQNFGEIIFYRKENKKLKKKKTQYL